MVLSFLYLRFALSLPAASNQIVESGIRTQRVECRVNEDLSRKQTGFRYFFSEIIKRFIFFAKLSGERRNLAETVAARFFHLFGKFEPPSQNALPAGFGINLSPCVYFRFFVVFRFFGLRGLFDLFGF